MQRSSAQLQEHALDLAWSMWAELGVSGWQKRHAGTAVDPEPLIIFTAWLGDADPRLRDESTDWCIRFGRFISAARLKNFVLEEPEDRRALLGRYAATVAAHSTFRWPFAGEPRQYQPTGRSRMEDLGRPSLVGLRLRAVFGVSARAEILRTLLAKEGSDLSAAELVPDVGYTKRNIAEALEALRLAGVVEVIPWRNQLKYRLARVDELIALVGPKPDVIPRWRFVLRVVAKVLETMRTAERLQPRARLVEVDRGLHEMRSDLLAAGITGPDAKEMAEERETTFRSWAVQLSRDLASGEWGRLGKHRNGARVDRVIRRGRQGAGTRTRPSAPDNADGE